MTTTTSDTRLTRRRLIGAALAVGVAADRPRRPRVGGPRPGVAQCALGQRLGIYHAGLVLIAAVMWLP
jgi:hypothetical protein